MRGASFHKDRMVSMKEAADFLCVSYDTVRNWIKEGKLERVKNIKPIRVRVSVLERFKREVGRADSRYFPGDTTADVRPDGPQIRNTVTNDCHENSQGDCASRRWRYAGDGVPEITYYQSHGLTR